MTRGNVYVHDKFIGELGSDCYPGGGFYEAMQELDTMHCTEKEFRKFVKDFIKDHWGAEYLPPKSKGVGNWSYEFMWVATQIPKTGYTDWKAWGGNILVRTWNLNIKEELGGSPYYQIPDAWMTLEAMAKKDRM